MGGEIMRMILKFNKKQRYLALVFGRKALRPEHALHAALARPLLTRHERNSRAGFGDLSLQLGVLPIPIDDYPQNEKTRFDDLERIRQHFKFIRCEPSQRERLLQQY
jgi:hypothetical protein